MREVEAGKTGAQRHRAENRQARVAFKKGSRLYVKALGLLIWASSAV